MRVGELCSYAETARSCHSVVPITESLIDLCIIVMGRLYALVAYPMTRDVSKYSIRSQLKQSFD